MTIHKPLKTAAFGQLFFLWDILFPHSKLKTQFSEPSICENNYSMSGQCLLLCFAVSSFLNS